MFLTAFAASATTYYIDFNAGDDHYSGTAKTVLDSSGPWKHAPGMSGFAGEYNHAAGDIFIFKGGVTWTEWYPWNIADGGTADSHDTYSTDHSWYAGANWSQPVFDGQHNNAISVSTSSSYLTLNDLKFQNIGSAHDPASARVKALQFLNSHDISVTSCTFSTETWITLYFPFTSAGSYSNFVWTGNDFSHTSGAVWFASTQADTSEHNVIYTGNVFHDFSSQIGNGVHGDGALHYFSVPRNDPTQYVDGLIFCNNRFYGDFRNTFDAGPRNTALFYAQGSMGATICNNDMSFSPSARPSIFEGLIVLDGGGNLRPSSVGIYNNTLVNIGPNSMSAAIVLSDRRWNVTLKNNIVSGMQYGIFVEDNGSALGFVSDSNLWHLSGGLNWLGSILTYSEWRARGFDTHPKRKVLGRNPSLVSPAADDRLKRDSPAIGSGADLSSLGLTILNSDADNVPRGNRWDMGAYQYIAH